MENIYRSPDEAYPFLADEPQDLRCDFELLTDELASLTGLLAAKNGGACAERRASVAGRDDLSCQSHASDAVHPEAGGGGGAERTDGASDA